jgi:hypothetical protein
MRNLATGLDNGDCAWDDCRNAETCGDAPETPAGMSVGYGKSPHAEGGCRSCTGDGMKMNGIRRCGATSQSTMGWGSPDTPGNSHGEPGVAIDGNANSEWGGGSCTHTDLAPAWWQVDLGQQSTVTKVNVWHRSGCCPDRLETAQVYVSPTPDFGNGRPCSPLSDANNNPETTTCAGDGDVGGVTGQYVTIYLQRKDDPTFIGYHEPTVITMCEMEIWGRNRAANAPILGAANCQPNTCHNDGHWIEVAFPEVDDIDSCQSECATHPEATSFQYNDGGWCGCMVSIMVLATQPATVVAYPNELYNLLGYGRRRHVRQRHHLR